MPNGFVGSRERWIELERALAALDPAIGEFAASHQLAVEKDSHSWPSRRLRWASRDLERLVEVTLDGETDPLTYTIRAYTWRDAPRRRRSKIQTLQRGVPGADLTAGIRGYLERAVALADSWTDSDLDTETPLAR